MEGRLMMGNDSEIACSYWAVLTQNADSLTFASILFSILTASEGIS
jgi:hypothetical protein